MHAAQHLTKMSDDANKTTAQSIHVTHAFNLRRVFECFFAERIRGIFTMSMLYIVIYWLPLEDPSHKHHMKGSFPKLQLLPDGCAKILLPGALQPLKPGPTMG